MTSKVIEQRAPDEVAGVVIPWFSPPQRPSADRLSETAGLVEALGCRLGFLRADQVREANPGYLLSGGLLERMAEDISANGCTLAVIDGSLSPVQQRNLEKRLGVKVIDRTGLILEIFGLRARTKEGRLQVELARLLYERSRLVRTWTHLERQRGGSGFLSGPGESQLEADRRMLDDKILRLRRDIEEVKRTREVQRAGRRRSGTPVIALVGYTNAGKSTLFNRLTGADVFARDMPFATLDPTIRKLILPSGREGALVDTVGFITDLPTHLIDSFQATLEEAMQADLLIHVRDRSSRSDPEQARDVESVLEQLETATGLARPPMIEAWNKVDLLPAERASALAGLAAFEPVPCVCVSAVTGAGIDLLLERIEQALTAAERLIDLVLPLTEGRARAWLHSHGKVEQEQIGEDGSIHLRVRLDAERFGQFAAAHPGLVPAGRER